MSVLDFGPAPEQWWEAPVPEIPPYAPAVYTVPDSANLNHAMFSGLRDNEFTADADGLDSSYVDGVVKGLIVMAIVGAVSILASVIIYFILGRAKRCCSGSKAKRPGARGAAFAFFLFWLLALAGFGVTVWATSRLNTEVDHIGEASGELSRLLTKARDLGATAGALGGELGVVVTGIVGGTVACLGELPLVGGLAPDVPDIGGVMAQLSEQVTELTAITNSVAMADAIEVTTKVADGIEDSDWRLPVIIAVSCVVGALVLMYGALTLCTLLSGKAAYYGGHKQRGKRCCGARACTLRLAALLGLLLLIVLWALLVGSTGVAMLSGDFCQSPNEYVLDITEQNQILNFYMTCDDDGNKLLQTVSAIQNTVFDVVGGVMGVTTTLLAVPAVGALCGAENVATLQANTAKFNQMGWTASSLATAALDEYSCANIGGLYDGAVYDTLCKDLSYSVTMEFLGLLLLTAGALGSVLLWRFITAQANTPTTPLLSKGGAANDDIELAPTSTVGRGRVV